MARAQRGGEVGKNGEFYEGGKFLPSTDRAKVLRHTLARGRRARIEPGGELVAVPEGKASIWESVRVLVDGAARFADPSAPLRPINNPTAIEYHGGQEVLDRIAAYNRGERWFSVPA